MPEFNDYHPKYVCCHVRSCALAIGILHALFGFLSVASTIAAFVEGKHVIYLAFGGAAGCFVLVSGILLMVGITNERTSLFQPFILICILNIVLLIAQATVYVAEVLRVFEKFDTGAICIRIKLGRNCAETGETNLIIIITLLLLFFISLEVYFIYKVNKARLYLVDKFQAKRAENLELMEELLH